jgi:ectoine hydroxylase-related dioxygenase (phytanoyl-CoA dioxygenase family)
LEVLEKMIAIRIHLDDTTADNGCLEVISESHKLGLLDSAQVNQQVNGQVSIKCEGKAGSAVIMQPNLLHRSAKIRNSQSRRVLHLEFCSFQLPQGLAWV